MALNYNIPLDQSNSHNGFERYNLLPANGGRDAYRFEYIREFDSNLPAPSQAELDKRNAVRAFLLLCLNDATVLTNLASAYNAPSVTDADSFVANIAARLAA